MTDPIADMFTRIRNASAVKKAEIVLPLSKLKLEIAKIMEKEGWIKKAEVLSNANVGKKAGFDELRIALKYQKSGRPSISSIKRISKPGLRVYVDKDHIPTVLNTFGIAILSTCKGVMTNHEARKEKIGGELISLIS